MEKLRKDTLEVTRLRTEHTQNPLGLEERHPRFSWQLDSSVEQCYQIAYQIIVKDEKEKVVWDTGKVISEKQNEVIYEGKTLHSAEQYQWKVRVWDRQERASAWSESAVFEMGLLMESDWKAKWISGNSEFDPLEDIYWIGYKGNEQEWVEFFCTFCIEHPLQQAVFDGTGFESWELYCNGELWRKMNQEWRQTAASPIRYADLTEYFKQGENTLCLRVAVGKEKMAAAIGKLQLRDIYGKEIILSTDEHWQVKYNRKEEKPQILGRYGIEPYGRIKRRGIAPLLRKEFTLVKKVSRARLYVCGLGYAYTTLNGKVSADILLGTEYSQYHKRVYYRTLDVTSLLKVGKNCLGAELGRGHYSFHRDWVGMMEEQGEPKLLLQLAVWYEDGGREWIVSDESWKTTDGPTVDDDVWYGEKYDARRLEKGWNQAGFDDSKWKSVLQAEAPGGNLCATMVPPIQVTEELRPVSVSKISDTICVYDFGKVTAGGAGICVRETKGTRIRLTYGETLLENGRVDMKSPNKVLQFWEPGQVDSYICNGDGEESWSPKFTYKGYRYIEVEGVDHEITLIGQVFHNHLRQTGSFVCSNELFNKIHGLVTPTILNNFHSIPTDTPAYEKRGWTGDAQSICDTALRNLDAELFFEKWLQDLCDSQKEDGAIPDTCPGPLYYPEAPEWMCAIIILPYQLYMHCGNLSVLKKYASNMEHYMEYEILRLKDGMSSNRFYGDWNSPIGARPPEGTSYNATCFVYRCLKIMEEISGILGKEKNQKRYKKIADEMCSMLNERYFDEKERLYHGEILCGFRQTPTVLPLAFGIAPEEKRAEIAKSLAEHIHREDNDHLSAGCMGLKFLAPVLTKYGQAETAYKIVDQTDFPSWGYWIQMGATTCWEEWTCKTRSVDHFYFGTVDDWFYHFLAGIRPIEAGYHKFAIKPHPCGILTEVKSSIETPYGMIEVHWKLESRNFCLDVSVPVNTTARICMPQGEIYEKGSGNYQIQATIDL